MGEETQLKKAISEINLVHTYLLQLQETVHAMIAVLDKEFQSPRTKIESIRSANYSVGIRNQAIALLNEINSLHELLRTVVSHIHGEEIIHPQVFAQIRHCESELKQLSSQQYFSLPRDLEANTESIISRLKKEKTDVSKTFSILREAEQKFNRVYDELKRLLSEASNLRRQTNKYQTVETDLHRLQEILDYARRYYHHAIHELIQIKKLNNTLVQGEQDVLGKLRTLHKIASGQINSRQLAKTLREMAMKEERLEKVA